ncbi:M20 family metallopeptidase [Brevibacillus humidisoli]|uniref:M20 metallopeptidase family protein n=1 Tax=Brevibacillus humidisoli TaxID=2895522 RepID=UPI001E42AF3A|nr:M20 family metallopeptidase [Brevibacillus humidisoli]UFJ42242.1 M20 family metallopeptidase [Brevibacillus humidisoli]
MKVKNDSMVAEAEAMFPLLQQWRRHLHQYPELSFQEVETSRFVVDQLSKMPGVHIQTGIAKTGVIGRLSCGSGPTIAIRADMDALPIVEKANQPYCSKHDGVMHACGHDAHTTILLGAAKLLSERMAEGSLQGTVKFLFQPAEENADDLGLTGAPYMIREGALDGVDAVIALHMNPGNPYGEMLVHDGYSMANVDTFQATVMGTGGHCAYPHLGTDPIWVLGPVFQALHGIVTRRVTPLEPAVISIGCVEAGSTFNVIPTEATVKGTLRSYDPAIRELLIAELEKAFSIVKNLGGNYTLHVVRGEPALKNDPRVNRWIRQTITELYPESRMIAKPFGLGGEDFGWMTQAVPGAMIFLGAATPDGVVRDLHTPIFDIDERVLSMGAAIFAHTASKFLEGVYQM